MEKISLKKIQIEGYAKRKEAREEAKRKLSASTFNAPIRKTDKPRALTTASAVCLEQAAFRKRIEAVLEARELERELAR